MPYVDEVEQTEANPELRGIYERIEKNFGFVPHFFKALGPMPEAIKAHLEMNTAIMGEGALSTLVKEQIGVVVSGSTRHRIASPFIWKCCGNLELTSRHRESLPRIT